MHWPARPSRAVHLRLLLAACMVFAACSAYRPAARSPVSAQTGAPRATVALPLVVRAYREPLVTYSRYGIGAPLPYTVDLYPVDTLRAAWYWDWAARADAYRPRGVEYYPTVRLGQTAEGAFTYRPDDEAIARAAVAHPGAVWLIGNEPDCILQDGVDPDVYAAAYAHLYALIKNLEPTAVIAAGQIVQPTPMRLEYLDKVLEAYRARTGADMPVDAWAIHAYPLNEDGYGWGAGLPPGADDPPNQGLLIDPGQTADPALFFQLITAFRHWMLDRGYRDTPLLVTEFGVLMPTDYYGCSAEDVVRYMRVTFDFLEGARSEVTGYPADNDRLVQRWAWYSLTNDPQSEEGPLAGWLYDANTRQPSASGEAYRSLARALPRTVNLRPARLTAEVVASTTDGQSADVRLTAAVVNNGSVAAGSPVRVRFYAGDPSAGGDQIAEDQVIERLAGGAVPRAVQVTWTAAPAGDWEVVVVVDADGAESETDEGDNVLRASVSVPPS